MSRFEHVEDVARALLYEGLVLYPYRASALKNQRRFPLGALLPRAYAEAMGGAERWALRVECLAAAPPEATIHVELRFLRAVDREAEAIEVRAPLPPNPLAALDAPLEQHDDRPSETDEHGRRAEAIAFSSRIRAQRLGQALHRVEIEIRNTTCVELDGPTRRGRPDDATRRAMTARGLTSAHVFLGIERGELVSLLEPPDELRDHAAACANDGVFPVLVGPRDRRDTMLASPVLVYDYPRLAPESPGDTFDATEIDELIALRVLTLTDAEKDEVRRRGGAAAELLARTERLTAREVMDLHGRTARAPREAAGRDGRTLSAGDAVRIHPSRRADAMDLALRGRRATVASIEQEIDGVVLVAVTVDDDPGRDLGLAGWPGHRFFFHPDELERVTR
ncbi:MAG: hypothetical protein AB7S26_21635 [Sandaracinaceae bacterium]